MNGYQQLSNHTGEVISPSSSLSLAIDNRDGMIICLWSHGQDSRASVWPATTSPPPSSLSFSPFTHYTHLQPAVLLLNRIEMESRAQLSAVTATAPFVPTSGWCLGTSLRVYEQHLESSTTDGAPVAEGLPEEANGIGDAIFGFGRSFYGNP